MRIVEKVLYGFGGLLALILLFIAICHYNPGLAAKIGAGQKKGTVATWRCPWPGPSTILWRPGSLPPATG